MYTKQLQRVSGPMVIGRIVDADEAYGRPVPVPWWLVLSVVALAAIGRAPLMLLAALRGATVPAGSDHSLKELHAGPEIPVMPLWIRDENGEVAALEVHGYVHANRLMVGDDVRAAWRPQRRPDLPPRAHRLYNLTTGQIVRPHPNTAWGHLGLALLIQAGIGLVLTALMITAWVIG